MTAIIVGCVVVAALAVALPAARWLRRRRALQRPFPSEWREILRRGVYLYRHAPVELRDAWHKRIQLFLVEKTFEGCGGLVVTEEMKLVIAAEACLLLLNKRLRAYPRLRSILVYPHAYWAEGMTQLGTQFVKEPSLRAGESWLGGAVVLAWDVVAREAVSQGVGNVVLHEFAHQLDQEDGRADGAPLLASSSRYAAWARVFSAEYKHLVDDIARSRPHVLDAYGATNPAEFFAVATEAFFERPAALHRRDRELYEQLREYYQLDPVSWHATDGAQAPPSVEVNGTNAHVE